jgi:lipid-A-disaccharide synthase
LVPVLAKLPTILSRLRQTVDAVLSANPDVLVVIDSPGFTQRVAKRVRRARPAIPIINYVSPTVWAWKPWRAARMREYVDHVLALFPFEPATHKRLHGPPCTYVGHPLMDQLRELRSGPGSDPHAGPPVVLVLPGSRRGELARLLPPFGQALAEVKRRRPDVQFVLPTLTHLEADVRSAVSSWSIDVPVVTGTSAKQAAFRTARAALAASGTVTLELAIAAIPTVAAYKVGRLEEAIIRRLITVSSVLLPNLIVGQNFVPELLQNDCTPERLSTALLPLLDEGPERAAQLDGFQQLEAIMRTEQRPSEYAADIIIAAMADGRDQEEIPGEVRSGN